MFPPEILYEICLHGLDLYRVAIYDREFHSYISASSRLHRLQDNYTVAVDGKYQLCGRPHRRDGPTITRDDGTQIWCLYGKVHREDGPAMTLPDGDYWYYEGERHRVGGPARISADGDEEWYQHGVLHREGGPARCGKSSREEWYQHGVLHRDDGPAKIYDDGTEYWYNKGRLVLQYYHQGTIEGISDEDE